MWKNGNIVEKTKGNSVMCIWVPYRGSMLRMYQYTHYFQTTGFLECNQRVQFFLYTKTHKDVYKFLCTKLKEANNTIDSAFLICSAFHY